MAKQYILKEFPSQRKLEQSFKKAHRVIERAQKRQSNNGKGKSLVHMICELGAICSKGNILNEQGFEFNNPHIDGDRIILEQIFPNKYKYEPFSNGLFVTKNNNKVWLSGYKN